MEAVQRSNQYVKGKSEAFAGFRDMLAEEIVKAKPDAEAEVKEILEGKKVGKAPQQNGEAAGGDESH